jgi:hypothetical protein
MKRRGSFVKTTGTLALGVLLMGLTSLGAGCAGEIVPDAPESAESAELSAEHAAAASEAEAVESTSQAIGQCCSGGAFWCASNPWISVDYDPPGCGITKPRASSLCAQQCGAACVDSGWQNYCN